MFWGVPNQRPFLGKGGRHLLVLSVSQFEPNADIRSCALRPWESNRTAFPSFWPMTAIATVSTPRPALAIPRRIKKAALSRSSILSFFDLIRTIVRAGIAFAVLGMSEEMAMRALPLFIVGLAVADDHINCTGERPRRQEAEANNGIDNGIKAKQLR
jgi:hypothetical protein